VTTEKGKSTGGFSYGSCWMIPPSHPRPDILPPLSPLEATSPSCDAQPTGATRSHEGMWPWYGSDISRVR
jgi:hypothetical protein